MSSSISLGYWSAKTYFHLQANLVVASSGWRWCTDVKDIHYCILVFKLYKIPWLYSLKKSQENCKWNIHMWNSFVHFKYNYTSLKVTFTKFVVMILQAISLPLSSNIKRSWLSVEYTHFSLNVVHKRWILTQPSQNNTHFPLFSLLHAFVYKECALRSSLFFSAIPSILFFR